MYQDPIRDQIGYLADRVDELENDFNQFKTIVIVLIVACIIPLFVVACK